MSSKEQPTSIELAIAKETGGESGSTSRDSYKETCTKKPYPFVWCFTFMTFSSLLTFIIWIAMYGPYGPDYEATAMYIILPIFSVSLFLYLVNVSCSSTYRFLRKRTDTHSAMEWIETMKSTAPQISFHIECYHYETRTRTVTDSDGNTKTETYEEKVTTHRASEIYHYLSWRDVSEPISGFDDYAFIRLTFFKSWICANDETTNDMETKKQRFYEANTRDMHQSKTVSMSMTDFPIIRKEMLIESQPGSNKYMSTGWYWIFSLLGCSACYRLYFNTMCGRQKYTFIKEISI